MAERSKKVVEPERMLGAGGGGEKVLEQRVGKGQSGKALVSPPEGGGSERNERAPGMALELEVSHVMTNPTLGPWQREPNTEGARALTRRDGSETLDGGTGTRARTLEREQVSGAVVASREVSPAKEGLVEAVGVQPSRTQVKRRKAQSAGKSALSDEARYLSGPMVYWRRDGCEVQAFYPGRSAGFRRKPVGLRTQGQWSKTQQKSDHRVVPEGSRKGLRTWEIKRPGEGRR